MKKVNSINMPYSPEIIKMIIDEHNVMVNQFIIISQEQICEHISNMLQENLLNNNN
jgi:hypothetical protein